MVALAALPLLAALEAGPAAAEALAEGDRLFARRAEGRQGGVGHAGNAAAAAYRRALAADPSSVEARTRLLHALFFRGGFCGAGASEQREVFDEAKRVAEEGVERLEEGLPRKSPARLEALRRIPGAAPLYFWAAVSWGQWGMQHKLAAAWQGAAGRVRDLAQTALDLDPLMDQGSPYIILGRLHAEAPKIPLLTGWISRKKALEYLGRAHKISPVNTPALYFLADAILDHDPGRRAEAVRLLEACANAEPRPEYLVEDAHYAELARKRLAALR